VDTVTRSLQAAPGLSSPPSISFLPRLPSPPIRTAVQGVITATFLSLFFLLNHFHLLRQSFLTPVVGVITSDWDLGCCRAPIPALKARLEREEKETCLLIASKGPGRGWAEGGLRGEVPASPSDGKVQGMPCLGTGRTTCVQKIKRGPVVGNSLECHPGNI
jgi:hypothetical protein